MELSDNKFYFVSNCHKKTFTYFRNPPKNVHWVFIVVTCRPVGRGGVATDTPFMGTVPFHRKIKSPFSYDNKIDVVTFEIKSIIKF